MEAKRNFDAAKKKAQLTTPPIINSNSNNNFSNNSNNNSNNMNNTDTKEFDMSDAFDSQSLEPPPDVDVGDKD